MAGEDRILAGGAKFIDFQTDPSRYRHWKLDVEGDVATLTMDVDENGGLFEGYQLKLNSYDLGVDIELADAVQRLRFEHPGVKVVLLRSAKNRVFCAGANLKLRMMKSHAASRLLGEALGELRTLSLRKAVAGGDGFADSFPTAALAAMLQAKLALPLLAKADWIKIGAVGRT